MQTNTPEAVAARPLERRIDVTLPLEQIEQEVAQRLKRMARRVKMDGFRPGKVPLKLVERHYGAQVREEAIGEALEKAFGEAVRAQNLRVAGLPRIEPKQGAEAGRLEFSAVFEVYPEIRLASLAGRHIERPVLEVGEAEVDKTIEVLRRQRTSYHPAGRAAARGDRVRIDFTGRIDGAVFKGGEASDYVVVLGSGRLLPALEEGIIGMMAGDSRPLAVTFPTDYPVADLSGKAAVFDVTVKAVEAPHLPEVDAEFARGLGIEDGDVAKMRAEIRLNLEKEVGKRLKARLKEQAMQILLETHPFDVPRALVEQEARTLAEAARRNLAERGVDVKGMPVEPEWFAAQAERRVKLGLIIAELVNAHGLHAKPEQVRALIDEQAQSYERPEEVVRWYYAQPQRLAEVEALAIEENVTNWVVANVTASDKTLSFDELMGNAA